MPFFQKSLPVAFAALSLGAMLAVTDAHATTTNGSISATTQQDAQAMHTSVIGKMGTNAPVCTSSGIDAHNQGNLLCSSDPNFAAVGSLPFNVQGQQMMDLSLTGLGINVKPASEALDVLGYVRVRNVNGEGGTIILDGAPIGTSAGSQIYLENNAGTFRVINSTWNTQLFTVDQTGNVNITGNLFTNGEVQATGRLRIIGGSYGAVWNNAVNSSNIATTSLVLTAANDQYGGFDASGTQISGIVSMAVDDTTGVVTFNNGVKIANGGIVFPDNTVQTTASSYGGEYSQFAPSSGATASCTANYKTGGCSCPSGQTPHLYVDFLIAGYGTLQAFVCTSD